jgi:predicted acetyltransferase
MVLRFYLVRLNEYYRKNGLIDTLKRVGEKLKNSVYGNYEYVFCCDLDKLNPKEHELPPNFSVVLRQSRDDITVTEESALCNYMNREILDYQLKRRLSRGAILWLIKIEGVVAGFMWSIRKKPLSPYYLPLASRDVFLFDGAVFPAYRGRGVYKWFSLAIWCELKKMGYIRVIFDAYAWNKSVLSAFRKIPVEKLGRARRIKLGKQNIVLWIPDEENAS